MNDFKLHRARETLILNADGNPMSMLPLSTMSWQDAIKNVVKGTHDVMDYYEDWFVSSPSVRLQVPSVVITKRWSPSGRTVRFSGSNVYIRDEFTCQYCNQVFTEDHLTKEHVHPKKLGGRLQWENIVAACFPCNQRKSHHLNMKPITKPRKPSYGELVGKMRKLNLPLQIRHESWLKYVDWPAENIRLVPPESRPGT